MPHCRIQTPNSGVDGVSHVLAISLFPIIGKLCHLKLSVVHELGFLKLPVVRQLFLLAAVRSASGNPCRDNRRPRNQGGSDHLMPPGITADKMHLRCHQVRLSSHLMISLGVASPAAIFSTIGTSVSASSPANGRPLASRNSHTERKAARLLPSGSG